MLVCPLSLRLYLCKFRILPSSNCANRPQVCNWNSASEKDSFAKEKTPARKCRDQLRIQRAARYNTAMLYFESDYMEGAHPEIMRRLAETNMEQTSGYGFDPYCEQAREMIKAACGVQDAAVYFAVGGTQANAAVIDALLKGWQGVLASAAGHIAGHEAGAIEHCGHKVITLAHTNGKITAETVQVYLASYYADAAHEHMPQPGAVYISHPTEYGTLYTADELAAIHAVCKAHHIPLFVDGARLGYALAADGTDVTLPVLAKNCEVFYIGGTKAGALFGEAIVFTKPELAAHFFSVMKQHGAVLAKGRLLGIQFHTLFTGDLYRTICRRAIVTAHKLKQAFTECGFRLLMDTGTNQLFVILPNKTAKQLAKDIAFQIWEPYDSEHVVARFTTSWATTEQAVDAAAEILRRECELHAKEA